MPKVTFLPNPDLCPDGVTVDANEGDTICKVARITILKLSMHAKCHVHVQLVTFILMQI